MLPEINNTTKPRIFRSEEERRKAREAMRKHRAKNPRAVPLGDLPALGLTEAETAYIAGFFDGEGMVCLSRQETKGANGLRRNPSYTLLVRIGQSSKPVMDWLLSKCGGGYLSPKRVDSGRGHWVLSLKSHRAMRLLETILPYLIVKKEQATHAIAFQKLQSSHKSRYEPGRTGPIPIAAKEYAYKPYYFQLLKDLKKPT